MRDKPKKKTWKELEAEGVARCCACLTNRKTGKSRQCRRRAAEGSDWCDKHKGIMDQVDALNRAAIEAERASQERDPLEDDE